MANSVFVNLFGSGGGVSPVNPSLFPNGSAAAPSISFVNDPQSGRYLIGTDNVGESINGALVFDWNATRLLSTLQIQIPNGSAASPALVFANSATSGLYRIGADNVGFSAGGTLRWDYNTTRILSTLPIYLPNGAVGTPSLTFANDTDTGFSYFATGIRAGVGGVPTLEIRSGRLSFFDTVGSSFIGFGNATGGTPAFSLRLRDDIEIAWSSNPDGSTGDTSIFRSAARVITLGPTTGVRLDWSTNGTLRLLNFAGSADGIMRAASFNANGNAGANFGPAAVASITVVGGIVTAIS